MSAKLDSKWIAGILAAMTLTFLAVMQLIGWAMDRVTIAIPASLIMGVAVWTIGNVVAIRKDRESGFPAEDERSIRIDGKAAKLTVIAGSYFTLLLLWYQFAASNWFNAPVPDPEVYLILVALVQSVGYIAAKAYYSRSP